MASIILGAVGTAIGGPIGGAIGAALGSAVDSYIVQSFTPNQKIQMPRLDSLRVTSSTEGAVIPRVFGRMRMGGNLIWATDFVETSSTKTQGPKGGGGKVKTTTYTYTASFAIALCEGPIGGIGRMWADGKVMDLTGVTYRVYTGAEDQEPDPLIIAKSGADRAPAYRGTAYIIFENLKLEPYGNRLPQPTFEVFVPTGDSDSVEATIKAVELLPGAGEFALATGIVTTTADGVTTVQNVHAIADVPDLAVSLDNLENLIPNVESVTVPVAWFGNDLRCGVCDLKPMVETATRASTPVWSVNGISRAGATVLSQIDGLPAFGGTPADFAVVQAIAELNLRGQRVTLAPAILMDIPEGNPWANPYSDMAASYPQPTYPDRGLITTSPAIGFAGDADGSSSVGVQIAAFFGSAAASDFAVVGTTVTFTGSGSEWGYRRLVLHYAKLAVAAGGVDAFLIGSGLKGITLARDNTGAYPGVTALATLAADVKAIVGSGCKVGYAADWTEYNGRDRGGGSFDFHLDPLWSDSSIDFVGVNFFAPLSDWRDGTDHADAAIATSIYDSAYLAGNVRGGEGFDWVYADAAARAAQTRTPIADGLGKPWMFRRKDLQNFWANSHRNRSAGVEAGSTTGWVPQGKPIRLTALGCPAIDRGSNQPDAYRVGKSTLKAEPYFSRGYRDDPIQRAYLNAVLTFYGSSANNPTSAVYGSRMIAMAETTASGWDARPNPVFPEAGGLWTDAADWQTGGWIVGRVGSSGVGEIVKTLCRAAGMPDDQIDVTALTDAAEGYVINSIESPRTSIESLMRHFGFDATESSGRVRFVQRGVLPSITLTPDDMVPMDDEVGEAFELTRQQTTDLPQILKWQTVRSDEDYDPAPVESRRSTAASRRTMVESFTLAVPPALAQMRCDRALFEVWTGIEGLTFNVPPSRMGLEATDVILFDHDGRQLEFRVQTTAEEVTQRIEGIRQDRFAYDRAPGPGRPTVIEVPTTFGPPNAFFMDLPQLSDASPEYAPYMVADATPWPGTLSLLKSPTTAGFAYVSEITRRGTIGKTVDAFPQGVTDVWDMATTLTIDLTYGSLESVSDALIFEGDNAFAIEKSAGVWEVFQAANCDVAAPGRYRLSRLLRGQKGTEYAMDGTPIAAGARIVSLDYAVTPIAIKATDVNLPLNWIVGPSEKPISDPSFLAIAYTPKGAGLRCYSPRPVADPVGTPRTPGDFTIEWIRRDRSLVADAWDDGEVPMSEAVERYDVEILVASVVVRTLTVSSPSVVYTSAMQTADLGALLDVGDTLDVRVYQISGRVGRGIPLIHTIQF